MRDSVIHRLQCRERGTDSELSVLVSEREGVIVISTHGVQEHTLERKMGVKSPLIN